MEEGRSLMGSGIRVSASSGDDPQGSDKEGTIPWLLSFPCPSIGHHRLSLPDTTKDEKTRKPSFLQFRVEQRRGRNVS